MTSYSRISSVFFGIALFFSSCRDTSVSYDNGSDYFPLQTGHYVIYAVDEQRYSLTSSPILLRYQIKEVVGNAYRDVAGQTAFRMLRYRRISESEPWQPDSIWSARLVNNMAIRTENSQDFIKLHFPIRDQLTWNGNQFNTLGNDTYEIRNSQLPYHVFDTEYTPTVTIIAQNDSTLTAQDKRIEVYAHQIGLIYKEKTQLYFCTSSASCIGNYQIDYGIRQVYRIQSYGNE